MPSELFRRAQELLPDDLHILVSLGYIYGQQGRYPEAIETYLKAPSLLPEIPDANYHIAWCYYQVKQYEEGLRWVEKVLSMQPDNADALVMKGIILGAMGQYDAALFCYKRAAGY